MMAEKVEGRGMQVVVGSQEGGMSVYQLAASLTGSLAWPVAAVIIAVIFHRQIGALLGRIADLSWGEAKVSFNVGEKLDKIEAEARGLPVPGEEPAATPSLKDQVSDDWNEDLLRISPNAAILDAWAAVELNLIKRAKGFGIKYIPLDPPIEERLALSGLLTPSAAVIAKQMREIRNAAAHNNEMTATDALRFRTLTTVLEQSIQIWAEVLERGEPLPDTDLPN